MNKKQKTMLVRILISAALAILFALLPVTGWLRFGLFMIPYFTVGWDILRKALKGIKNRQPFDECFLMAVATIGAIALGEYTEGVAVMLFYQIGELFQSYAVNKSRRSISALMDIRPDYANIEGEDGTLRQVDPEEVEVGSVIVVQPGERVPIDGTVIRGQSSLNTAALTGESLPRDVDEGDDVISGCINMTGVLWIRTTCEFGESTVSRILELVENASSVKSRPENFISKFARIYTPAVCYSALALAILPPLYGLVTGSGANWGTWIYRALTFLVISCPCALVVSIPLSFFAGIGGASRAGVLIKGSNFMESLSRVKTVAFDKTGTVTKGVFRVTELHPQGVSERELLEKAALAEHYSLHPISRSLKEACSEALDESRVRDVHEKSGNGVTATVDEVFTAVGNDKLMAGLGITVPPVSAPGTVIHVALGGAYAGYILISDEIKPTAAEAISRLKKAGVTRNVMLTGDRTSVAEKVAKELGIDEVHAELLPKDKVELVEGLLIQRKAGSTLAFVGDGINDAPVLTRADVGIAMGALGSDAAIEAADVVLMDDDPIKIAKAIAIARKCLRIVYENIYFAIGVKLLCLLLGATGHAGMWLAIFADVGVMVLAVLNAIRALDTRRL